jgi:predicted PurR-regulated permease PerM
MSARHTFVVTLCVIATVVGAYLVWRLSEIFLLLLGAIIFASAVRPFVTALSERGIPRGLAIILIYILVLTAVVVLIIVSVPPLISFIVTVVQSGVLSTKLTQLATRLAIFGWDRFQVLIPVIALPAQLNNILAQTGEQVERQVWTITQSTAIGLGQALLLFTMTFYWLTSRENTLALLLLLSPKSQRANVNAIWNDVEARLGAYVRGQVFLMFIIGIASYIGLFILRVPFAPALALIAGITEAIPVIGPLIGSVPAIIVGFTVSPITGLLVALLYVIIQFLENNVLVPRVMSSNVGLNPLVVIIAIVAGSTLNGVIGALLAIPLAGTLQVLVQHIWLTPTLATLPHEDVGAAHEPGEDEEDAVVLPPPEVILAESVDDDDEEGPPDLPSDLPEGTSGEETPVSTQSLSSKTGLL